MESTPVATKPPNESTYILEGQQSVEDSTVHNDTEQLLEDDSRGQKKSSLAYASFNYINSIIGSGVIGIPYAFSESGFGIGLVLLTVVALMTDYSLVLMVRSGHLSGSFTYQGIMQAAFGKPGYFVLSALQFLYPFIAMISYNVVVGDTLTKVVINVYHQESVFASRPFVIGMANIFVTAPLCLYRELEKLSKISFASLVCVGFILIAVTARIEPLLEVVPPGEWTVVNKDMLPAIAIMAFAFMCHHNTFLVYSSIKDGNQQLWNKVTHISVTTSYIVTLLFGIAGYATFKQFSQGDLLENYCWDDALINVARVMFCFTILLTYPIEFLVTRDVIQNIMSAYSLCLDYPKAVHYGLTISLIFSTYLLSLTTDCLGIVLELNGILAAVPMAYVLPAIIYLKLEEGGCLAYEKAPAIALALAGTLCAVAGFASLITNFHSAASCSHGHIMQYCNITN
ncbi:putative sodium-coupled neutral amino acid transporter 11 [Schistocerca americana]|uniref:putative sodium-coupled neutral amino acid transporter 11 n=1 Tax=Schistocerca americana TaxID=7009 RepID=UPI001F4FB1E4|nr:putative sodium-coupled neutral amino acid transporter 11 [Schistocerca americana]